MELKTLLKEYIDVKTKTRALISESNFKVWLIKTHDIRGATKHPDWRGVRGELEDYMESQLLDMAAMGERNSQIYATLLTKLYEKQAKRDEKDTGMANPITFVIDVEDRDGK